MKESYVPKATTSPPAQEEIITVMVPTTMPTLIPDQHAPVPWMTRPNNPGFRSTGEALSRSLWTERLSTSRTFDTTFDDFFITSIGGDSETATEFWGILVNFQFTPVGGCQEEVKVVDEILWAFDAFNAVNFLKLNGPQTARRNQPVVLTVTDGQTGRPVAGAEVDGHTSGADGKIIVTFAKAGVNGVKASKQSAIRSNKVDILVLP